MSSSRYWELTVDVPDQASEGLTNFVWELGALGVVEEHTAGGAPRLRAFFPETAAAPILEASLQQYLEGLGSLGFAVSGAATIAPLEDPGWAEAWRAHFRPRAVGRQLVIAPPWESPRTPGRLVITIEPGRAFGTGHHGSTTGCLEMLEDILEHADVPRALDLGTGSGILAITAARLGVGRIVAIDDDPDAIANAMANAARNGVCDRVRCVLSDAGIVETQPAALVLANLTKTAHVRLAPAYRRYASPDGSLVLGGILDGEADELADALGREGWTPRDSISREGWTTLALSRAH